MYINATLLVQAVHFLIAYSLLRFFLYKPVVALIQKRDADKKALIENIAHKAAIIAQKEESIENYWQTKQQELLAQRPELKEQLVVSFGKEQMIEEIPHAEVEQLVEQVSKAIVNRIDHVS